MPDDVDVDVADSSPAPEPQEEWFDDDAPAPDPSDQRSDDDETSEPAKKPAAVPYDRFSQVNRERRALKDQLAERDRQILTLAHGYQNLQQQITQMQAKPTEAPTPAADPEEQLIRTQLGTDEAGQKAYDTLERFFQMKFDKTRGSNTSRQDLEGIKTYVDQRLGGLESATHAVNLLQSMVSGGTLTNKEAQEFSGQIAQVVQQQPQWAHSRQNMELLVNTLMGQAYRSGKLKARPGTSSPTQPGQAGGRSRPEGLDQTRQIASRFASLRSLGDKRLKVLQDRTATPDRGAA